MKIRNRFRATAFVVAVLVAASAMSCGNGAGEKTFAGSAGNGAPSPSVGEAGTAGTGAGTSAVGVGVSGHNTLAAGSGTTTGGDAGAFVSGDPRCDGGNTTISGTVYDPAIQDPLYNITVFLQDPAVPLPALPAGASCNACADLYPPTVIASAITDDHGNFQITKADPGPVIPEGPVTLVVQTGKWRKQFSVNVTKCQDNPQPDKTLHLPKDSTDGNLPDIAISTGSADSLECLPLRIGVSASEYVGGASGPGHIHIFTGNGAAAAVGAMPAATGLWSSTPNLLKNDVVLLSCEGAEPGGMTAASQQSMYDYANMGGRIFASHYHYAWFSNVVRTGPSASPFAMFNLATWKVGGQNIQDTTALLGDVVTTLNVGGGPFPEGLALFNWLGVVNALTNGKLPIFFTRHNADVTPINTASQPWIALDPTVPAPDANATEYFSFDTPVGATGAERCGRVVFSDIHVSGGPGANQPGVTADYKTGGRTTPAGCAMHPLTQQEKALEFMLFDLSSCLQSVGQPPTVTIPPPPR